ncbi:MAG: hypothetical protein K2X03_29135 [Bryobacteraceae bacterium]|nr:hypothetical protein [Bryobacteraceae bacterium]
MKPTSPPKIALETYPQPSAWYTYRIPLGGPYPMAPELSPAVRLLVLDILRAARAARPANLIGILQYNQLNLGGAGMIASKNGKQWGLDWGLAYKPEEKPPTLWTVDDFTNLDVGEMPRPMMNQIFGITTGDAEVMSAVGALFGRGAVLLALSEDPPAIVRARATGQFQPLIVEESLRHFAYYFPLLSAASFAEKPAGQIEAWTCGLTFYVRESPEDGGVFLASQQPLAAVFRKLKGRETKAGAFEWLVRPDGYAELNAGPDR